jgi:D-tyrosyl-tRNA(Tyr) deacylase
MRAVVQRVERCIVSVRGVETGRIERGVLVYLGISKTDTERDIEYIVDKVVNLRIFPDSEDKMNLSVKETGGGVMVVSQFTLYGDARKGRRPSWSDAATPERARPLFEACLEAFRARIEPVATGEFQAMMDVACTNKGPVTILLDSERRF